MTMISRFTWFMSVWVVFMVLLAGGTAAQLDVGVTEGRADPVPIAVTDFNGDGDMAALGADIASVVKADLEFSGLFRDDSFRGVHSGSQRDRRGRAAPVCELAQQWRHSLGHRLGVEAERRPREGELPAVRHRYRTTSSWVSSTVAASRSGGGSRTRLPMQSTIASSENRAILIRASSMCTRWDCRPTSRKRIAIMDYDGENHKFLTSGENTVLTPRFSPTIQQIAYFSYFNETTPRVYLLDLATGRREVLGDFPGMSFAPRFSPDGKKVIMSLAINGNTDIYVMDLPTRTIEQLTEGPHIDTSPSYSPDGSQIVFTSDRSGQTQIYIMDADGENQRRISWDRGQGSGSKASYSTPVWSPRGDLIAFTKHIPNSPWAIGVMPPVEADGGSQDRLLAYGDLVEGPTWSPNGRFIMFAHETYREDKGTDRVVKSIDLTGHVERTIRTKGAATDPAWSPLIP